MISQSSIEARARRICMEGMVEESEGLMWQKTELEEEIEELKDRN